MKTVRKRIIVKLIMFLLIMILFLKIIPMLWVYFQKDNIEQDKNIEEYTILDIIEYAGKDLNKQNESTSIDFIDEEPYEHQFLDELTNKSISTHFSYKWDDDESIKALKCLGINKIRDDIDWKSIDKGNGEYDFTYTDEYINKLTQNEISIVAIFYNPGNLIGSDKKISNQEELDKAISFLVAFAKRYPQIKEYEIWNEPNYTYKTEEDFYWYAKLVERASQELKEIDKEIEIISGATVGIMNDEGENISSKTFMQNIIKNGAYKFSDSFSFHIYDNTQYGTWFDYGVEYHKDITKESGGFLKNYITEYGLPTNSKYSEEEQARRIVRFSTILDIQDIDRGCIYTLRNKDLAGDKYGIINNNNTPKLAYYSLKNYLENTNGAEFIGEINLCDDLKSYVYDKEGSPKIITWVERTNDSVKIDYTDFIATDLYGNNIENTDGKLEITLSPIYIDNVSTNYFYQAISNTAIEKYSELEEDYSAEISSIEGLQEGIDELKQYMQSIFKVNSEDETTAKNKMEEHFNLGNLILEAYKNGNLNIEYVKLSSMLDTLNDIGNSFEDLVTVSSQKRNVNLQETKTLIDIVELDLKNNYDTEIIYPTKILEASKELYEKSEYINSLKEENAIKTGLIVSNNLHAKYLAEWANMFTNIYIDRYIENNPVSLSYSETKLTNKDVQVTLNSIANDIKITNNNSKNTYTFSKNGTFTFEYIRRGRNFTITATVENIDKEAPEITGVKDGTIYAKAVIPSITDKNLDNIQIKYNFGNIEYKAGKELSGEGTYIITATDKAGNTSKITFYIIGEKTENYIVKDKYIINIKNDTNVEDFRKKLTLKQNYKLLNNGEKKQDKDIVCTGDILELDNGEKYTLVVMGDLNSDGKITAYDLSHVRNYLLKVVEYNEIENLAANMNMDAKGITAIDYSSMREIILGII